MNNFSNRIRNSKDLINNHFQVNKKKRIKSSSEMDIEYGYEKQQLTEMAFDPKLIDLAIQKAPVKTLEGFIEWIEQNQDAVNQQQATGSDPNAMQEEKQTANPEGEAISEHVNQEFNAILQSMGYSKFVAEKALFFTQSASVEAAQEWIEQHKTDPDFEEELRIVKQEENRPKMTKEEAIQAAKELQAQLRAKRKAEEEKLEREREKQRIESTKALAQAKREAEEAQLKRDIEELKRQKKKDEEDKRKILEQLQRDKEERFGKKVQDNNFSSIITL